MKNEIEENLIIELLSKQKFECKKPSILNLGKSKQFKILYYM